MPFSFCGTKRELTDTVMARCFTVGILALLVGLAGSLPTFGHAFGARYQLTVPLYYYVLGAGLTVGLSFVVAAFFLKDNAQNTKPFRVKLLEYGDENTAAPPIVYRISSIAGVFVFTVILVAGFIGEQSPTRNIAPVFIWSIWWVGIVYVQALLGDVWRLVNPWAGIFNTVVQTFKCEQYIGRFRYPAWLCRWPAFLSFWVFAWFEQVAPFAEVPASLALLVSIYSLVTWVGMAAFGRDLWLERAEIFSILFGFLARIAPTVAKGGTLWLRPLGVGLITKAPLSRASTALILLLLASVTFDGFRDTQVWADSIEWALSRTWLFASLFWIQQQGVDLLLVLQTAGLILVPLLFFLSYWFIAKISSLLTGGGWDARQFAGQFVLTLLPIALAYHIAHYLAFLLLAGQLAVPLLSDPFHMGWDLFGTYGYQLDVGIIGVGTIWWVSMAAVVTGHIYGVYTAHAMAVEVVPSRKKAIVGQLPLILLMVGYTMASLWILAQPIIDKN